MIKKVSIGVMKKYAEIEYLARQIYLTHSAVTPDNVPKNYMRDSQHPTETACYLIAARIIDRYFK